MKQKSGSLFSIKNLQSLSVSCSQQNLFEIRKLVGNEITSVSYWNFKLVLFNTWNLTCLGQKVRPCQQFHRHSSVGCDSAPGCYWTTPRCAPQCPGTGCCHTDLPSPAGRQVSCILIQKQGWVCLWIIVNPPHCLVSSLSNTYHTSGLGDWFVLLHLDFWRGRSRRGLLLLLDLKANHHRGAINLLLNSFRQKSTLLAVHNIEKILCTKRSTKQLRHNNHDSLIIKSRAPNRYQIH